MDAEQFNTDMRKFLRRFGVTAQQEIEKAVAQGIEQRKLSGTETLPVSAVLSIPGVLPEMRIDGEIALGARPA